VSGLRHQHQQASPGLVPRRSGSDRSGATRADPNGCRARAARGAGTAARGPARRTVQRRLRALPSRVGVYFVLALTLFPELSYQETVTNVGDCATAPASPTHSGSVQDTAGDPRGAAAEAGRGDRDRGGLGTVCATAVRQLHLVQRASGRVVRPAVRAQAGRRGGDRCWATPIRRRAPRAATGSPSRTRPRG
jgi:hypothetical protein